MGLATTTVPHHHHHHHHHKKTLDNSLDSMSQDYHHHQGIFSFSSGFHRPLSSHQEEVEESAVSGAQIPVYETAGMLSEMFSYPGGGNGGSGEIPDHSTKQLLEQQNRHNNNNSTLHMLLPNHHHHQGYGYPNEQQFTWPSSSDHHQSQGDMIGTVHVEGGKGLSLSLSSSLEAAAAAAKAEEYRSIYCAAVDGTSSSSNASVHHHQFNQLKTLLLDNSSSHQHQVMGHFGSSSSSPMAASSSIGGIYTLRNSKYTKPAQELLEEFCSVGRGHNFKKNKLSRNNSNPNTSGCGGGGGGGGGGSSSSAGAANDNPPLSPADRIEHQRRKVKLLSMLEEVDRRYNHYCEQMQMVVNSFDQVMGYGAAVPYTTLAQKAMSRHFRCLKDAVAVQLKRSCELLGDKESAGAASSGLTKGETPRLRLLEQSLRQQRAFHHMGMMEQEAWRPQRGLPERSVNILRAWLFEHFLNPFSRHRKKKVCTFSCIYLIVFFFSFSLYITQFIQNNNSIGFTVVKIVKSFSGLFLRYPSDADKHLLARQTGLSRNQVSNWFINARVRLWKPMVEEMYQQEAKEREEEELGENKKEDYQHQRRHQQTNNKDTKPNESSFTLVQTITAQTPTTTMMTSTPHENDPSSLPPSTSVANAPSLGVSGAFTVSTCQQDVSDFHVEDGVIRFGTKQAGDVSLTLGLRHTGNMPDNKNPSFSVRDFGDF